MIRRRLRLGSVVMAGALAALLIGASGAWADDTLSATCSWAGQSQTCDSSVWYPSAVTLVWQASTNPAPDSTTCPLSVSNHYDSDTVSTISCSATWNSSGTTRTQHYTLHVETSSPTATASPSRAPDSNGWYNHAVTASVVGSAFSGIASCIPTTYAGPSSTTATVGGVCTDNAGKSASATSPAFSYDASPPSVAVSADAADGVVVLHWAMADIDPLATVAIERVPGRRGKAASLVYQKPGSSFKDTRLRDGIRYRYTLVATDLAGNTTTRVISVIPGPRLLAPARDALLTTPPLLQWTPVRGASYYNVQLYRGRKKILSLWPTHAALQLSKTWRFGGLRHRLSPGRYRWYVWPGFGPRAEARYGRQVGIAIFTMT